MLRLDLSKTPLTHIKQSHLTEALVSRCIHQREACAAAMTSACVCVLTNADICKSCQTLLFLVVSTLTWSHWISRQTDSQINIVFNMQEDFQKDEVRKQQMATWYLKISSNQYISLTWNKMFTVDTTLVFPLSSLWVNSYPSATELVNAWGKRNVCVCVWLGFCGLDRWSVCEEANLWGEKIKLSEQGRVLLQL